MMYVGEECGTTFMDMELLTEKAAQIKNDYDGKGQLNRLPKGLWIMPDAEI